MCLDRKVIIFGAGKNGENILKRLGSHNVACFCDNYKWGMEVCGKKVINFTELQNMGNDVVLSVNNNEIKKM